MFRSGLAIIIVPEQLTRHTGVRRRGLVEHRALSTWVSHLSTNQAQFLMILKEASCRCAVRNRRRCGVVRQRSRCRSDGRRLYTRDRTQQLVIMDHRARESCQGRVDVRVGGFASGRLKLLGEKFPLGSRLVRPDSADNDRGDLTCCQHVRCGGNGEHRLLLEFGSASLRQ